MVHYFWDFTKGDLQKLDPMVREELAVELRDKLKIPVSSHIAGFNNPYIEIESNDPVRWSPLWKDGMIPRAGFIQRVSVRHLTHQSQEYVDKVIEIGSKFLEKHLKE